MRIQILSDLHKECYLGEYWASKPNTLMVDPATNVLILAGDIIDWKNRFQLYHEFKKLEVERPDLTILYVPGNHEFYGTHSYKFDAVMKELRSLYSDCTRVEFLYNDHVSLPWENGIVYDFLGTTLWSAINDPMEKANAKFLINDFRASCLDVHKYHQEHQTAVRFIEETCHDIREGKPGTGADEIDGNDEGRGDKERRLIVITHHAPSPSSCHIRFHKDPANYLFFTDLSQVILANAPRLWVHGHMHDSSDYRVEETRVLCNPRGYPGEHDHSKQKYAPLTLEI